MGFFGEKFFYISGIVPHDWGFFKILGYIPGIEDFYSGDREFFKIWGVLSPGIGNFWEMGIFFAWDGISHQKAR